MNNKGFAPIILLIGAVIILAVVGGVYYVTKKPTIAPQNNPQSVINNQQQVVNNQPTTTTADQQPVINFNSGCPKQGDDSKFKSISGRVVFPKGIKNSSSFGLNAGNSTMQKISPDGYFCGMYFYPKNTLSLIEVVSGNPNDFRLSAFINPINNSDNIVIDAKSTAAVLTLFNSGYTKSYLEIENNPKVKDFASAIDNADVLTASSIKPGGNLYAYLVTAINSVK